MNYNPQIVVLNSWILQWQLWIKLNWEIYASEWEIMRNNKKKYIIREKYKIKNWLFLENDNLKLQKHWN